MEPAALLVRRLDLVGTFVFAVSGAAFGVQRNLDLFGVLVLAFMTAIVGGITRDVLIGAVPPSAIASWHILVLAVAAELLVFYLAGVFARVQRLVLVFVRWTSRCSRSPTPRRRSTTASPGPWPPCSGSKIGLLGEHECVVDLDTDCTSRAFKLAVPEQKLAGPAIAGALVSECDLRAPHAVVPYAAGLSPANAIHVSTSLLYGRVDVVARVAPAEDTISGHRAFCQSNQ